MFHGVESSGPALPLTEALADLLGELSALDPEPRVASPRHVMLALEPYAKQFDLALQQDAAEALAYLTSALQEERLAFFESFRAYRESLSNASRTCINGGPLNGIVMDNESEAENSPLYSWKQQLRWPMEGMMGSMLTCQECGFQFSTQFQSFHDVPLSPPRLPDGNIVDGCNLEACLERFTAPECISNVRCSLCSHALIVRLLQRKEGINKDLLRRIEDCTFDDDCSCESLVTQVGEPWRNVYVNAFKQLRFGRCPEVICCHMQRAVIGRSGDLVKWTGHVSFPFVLNLFPYTMSAQGYSQEKYGSFANPPVQLMGHGEVLQKYLWQRRAFEMHGKVESQLYRAPLSTDESTSDDTHLSTSSGSEDFASDSSFESMPRRLEDEVVDKCKEQYEPPQLEACTTSTGCGDSSYYGLDSIVFGQIGHSFVPPDNKEPLCLKFRDCASLFEPCLQMAPNHHPFLETSRPKNNAQKSSTTMLCLADADVQGLHRGSDKLPQVDPCNSGRWLYELISVVVHHGSPRNGHYTVYRKAKLKNDDNTQKSDNGDTSQEDAMDMNECESVGGEEETTDRCAVMDSSTEKPSTNALNCADFEMWDSNGAEIEDVNAKCISAETLSRSDEELVARQDTHTISPTGVSSGCWEEQLEARQGTHTDAPLGKSIKSSWKPTVKEERVFWFRVSDSHVDVVTEQEVLMAQATLLFYEHLH